MQEIYNRYQRIAAGLDTLAQPASTASHMDAVVDQRKSSTLSTVSLLDRPRKRRRSTTTVILETMNELYEGGRLRRQNINLRQLSRALYERYDIASEEMAKEVVKVQAKPLFVALGSEWATSPIYVKLEKLLSQPEKCHPSLRKEAKNIVLNPRSTQDESTSNVVRQEPEVNADLISIPAPGRRRKRTSSQAEQEEDSNSSEQRSLRYHTRDKGKGKQPVKFEALPPRCRASSRSGKVAALRLAPSSPAQKRPLPSPGAEDYEDDGSRKRSKILHSQMDEDVEDADSSNESPELEPDELDEEEISDVKEKLTLTSEPLLSAEPQGPNGLWECTREGCGYCVTRADKPAGNAKVHAHFLEHADEIAARENIVLAESRPYLPIE